MAGVARFRPPSDAGALFACVSGAAGDIAAIAPARAKFTHRNEKSLAMRQGSFLWHRVQRTRLILEIPGEVGDQTAAVALEVEDLVQRLCQRPLTATAGAGARLLLGRAQPTHPVEVVVGGDAAQHFQPFGQIAAAPVEAAAHFADFV